jgi:Tol biopolymer transport system component
VPPHVSQAVHTALQKLPADRFPSAAEFGRALENPGSGITSVGVSERPEREAGWKPTRRDLALGGLALALGALAAWGWLRPVPEPVPRVAWVLPVPLPDSAPLTTGMSLSQDGSLLVYSGGQPGRQRIWVRPAGAALPTPIEGSEGGEVPAVSPDGRRVAFHRSGLIYVVPIEGGEATQVADSVVFRNAPAWLDDNHLVFANQGGLERVDVRGGARERVTRVDSMAGEGVHGSPSVLPGGRGVVFTVQPAGADDLSRDRIAVTEPGGRHLALIAGARAHYAHPGHLLVLRADGVLVAVPFDVPRRRVTGSAHTIASGLTVARFSRRFAVSASGRVAFVRGAGLARSDLVRVLPNGRATPVDTGWVEDFASISVSPDGRRVAAGLRTLSSEEIQVRDLVTGGFARIDLRGFQLRNPVFSPDGATIIFSGLSATQLGIYRVAPGSSAAPEQLLRLTDPPSSVRLSPDGRTLYYNTYIGAAGDLFAYALDLPGSQLRTIVATPAIERYAVPSPDGQWLAYISDESGRGEVFVRSANLSRTERWQVSRTGVSLVANPPRWARDGRELFYVSRDSLIAAHVAPGEAFAIAEHRMLFSMAPYTGFDVLPGGGFLMIRNRPSDPRAQRLMLLEDWKAGAVSHTD